MLLLLLNEDVCFPALTVYGQQRQHRADPSSSEQSVPVSRSKMLLGCRNMLLWSVGLMAADSSSALWNEDNVHLKPSTSNVDQQIRLGSNLDYIFTGI